VAGVCHSIYAFRQEEQPMELSQPVNKIIKIYQGKD
jgi:hypothetical protein